MSSTLEKIATVREKHTWLKKLKAAYVPGHSSELLAVVVDGLVQEFKNQGHEFHSSPGPETDVIFTTARFNEAIPWRRALFFTARRKFSLPHNPTVFAIVGITPAEYERELTKIKRALEKSPIDPDDFRFDGMAPGASRVLIEQGLRGGALLALERQMQAQVKSVRILLVVGEDLPDWAHLFDLVGAYPRIERNGPVEFYQDIVTRMTTVLSTFEITDHQVVGEQITKDEWGSLSTPAALIAAAPELGKRNFFTEMLVVANLVSVPAVSEGVANQYSEGCFATWDSKLNALVTTITGSARPVEKDEIGEDDLAIIAGVRPDGQGALVRHVDGKTNDPPSSEAVELMDMDSALPQIHLPSEWGISDPVPVVRSKLHGHRSIASYDSAVVEHVRLDPAYYYYPVSCATQAQAIGIKAAFARSEALNNPDDPRKIVFTMLPGHGVVIAEKWVHGKAPLQLIWESMDDGTLEVENLLPQGFLDYVLSVEGRMILNEEGMN
jgi:hypothetical protein